MKEERIMKKSVFIGLAAVLGLIGCTRNQEIDIQENGLTLVARTESPAESRTVVEEGVHVFWEPGDEIAVFMGEKMARFTTDLTAASGTATFKGTFGDESWPEEPDLWAVYPYSEETSFDGETITTVLPSEQVAREGSFGKDMNLSIAHSNSSTLQFYNVGGGVRFSLVQSGIQRITFEGTNNETLAGTVTLAFDGGVPAVRQITNGETILTLTAPDGGSFEPGKWYYIAALPCNLDEGFVLKFYKNGSSAARQFSSAVSIRRGLFGSLANVDEGLKFAEGREHLFSSVVTLDSSSITSCVVDDTQGTCVISFDERAPEIHSGAVLCLDPEQGGQGVFLVTSATTNGDTVEMKGRRGDLSYVFNNTSFTLSTGSASSPSSLPSSLPKSLRYDNQWELWRGEYAEDFTLFKDSDASLTASFKLNSGLDAEFYFAFNGVVESFFDGVKFLKSKNFTTRFKLSGDFDCHTSFNGKVIEDVEIDLRPQGQEDRTELLKHNFLPAKDFVFPVWGVPVIIHLGCDLYEQVSAEMKGELDLTASIDAAFRGECGFSYNDGNGSQPFQPFNNYSLSVEKQNPTLSGWGEFALTYYVFPRFYAWIEYTTGPALEIRPYAKTTLSGALQADLVESSTAEYLSSSFKGSVGAEWAIGLSTPLENYYYESSRTMKDMGTIKEFDVVTSPVALELTYANQDRVRKGVSTSLRLSAMAEYYGERAPSIYPTIVKIEVPAANISTYRSSWTGTVDYDWVPQSDADILYAKIFNHNGEVIDEVQFGDGESMDQPDAVDLGLSVKWATVNIGASAPHETGDYFAWGETEPKSSYTWNNYKWYSSVGFTRYCIDTGSGIFDNQLVLLPEDDAAQVKWGGGWRMPTSDECRELISHCTWTYTTLNGVNGYYITDEKSKAQIFLPAGGAYRTDTGFGAYNAAGNYWSSSLPEGMIGIEGGSINANYITFGSKSHRISYESRAAGFNIRPVYDD